MGTQLLERGLRLGECAERWNLVHPQDVAAIHRAYLAAGARILLTNTFGANPTRLAPHGLADRLPGIASAAAALARTEAEQHRRIHGGPRIEVWGSVGPTGLDFRKALSEHELQTATESFREAIAALLVAEVDCILIETMTTDIEAHIALAAAVASGAPRIAVSFACFARPGGKLPGLLRGADPVAAGIEAARRGAHIVGLNCGDGMGPAQVIDILRLWRADPAFSQVRTLVRLNAGTPIELPGDHPDAPPRYFYPSSPELFSAAARQLAEAAVHYIGGCCGTTPAMIAAARNPDPQSPPPARRPPEK